MQLQENKALNDLSREQRELVSSMLLNHPRFKGKQISYIDLNNELRSHFGVVISATTVERVFRGGELTNEDRLVKAAPAQGRAIAALFSLLGLDVAQVAPDLIKPYPSFEQKPHLYFPAKGAFGSFSQTAIRDCSDRGALKHLINSCKGAIEGRFPSDGHDKERLIVATLRIESLEDSRGSGTQAQMALLPVAVSEIPATTKIKVSVDKTGFSIDQARNVIATLKEAGMPTGEVKAAIMQRLAQEIGLE